MLEKTDYIVVMPKVSDLIEEYGLKPNGRLQKVVDSTIVSYSSPYTPRDEGILEGSVVSSIGSGMLEYKVPYAHWQWIGVSQRGVSFKYQKKNPLAGRLWVIRAMADHLEDVCRIAEKELKK